MKVLKERQRIGGINLAVFWKKVKMQIILKKNNIIKILGNFENLRQT